MEKEKIYEKQIEKLQRKNFYKNIVIIILSVLFVSCLVLAIPTVKRVAKKIINEIQEQQVVEQYNSKYKLNLMSAYGDIEAYHPKVLSFEKQWNGYYYWMSFTPYPDSDESKENPHVVASNDMIHWEKPNGAKNPIDEVIKGNENKYNSDSHIVMNDTLNRLECYWRYVDDEANQAIIYRKYTEDGVNWSEKEIVAISYDRKKKDYVSPAIIYENGIYKIWYVDKQNTVKYAEARDGENWKDIKIINIKYPQHLKSWHLDVIKTEQGYEMIMMAYKSVKERGNASLYYTKSADNNEWSECKEIIKPTKGTNNWDNRGIYRSSMIKKDGIYYVFYSASNKKNIKGTGIMYGKNIEKLHNVDINYCDKESIYQFQKLIEQEK